MKIKVRREEILKELKLVNSIVEKKGYMVVLSYVLLQTEDSYLRISATDLEISYVAKIQAEIIEHGEATVQASAFFDLIKDMDDEFITIECRKDETNVNIYGSHYSYSLLSVHPDNFPTIPQSEDGEKFEIDFPLLKDYLKFVEFAISEEHLRDVTGANVEIKHNEMRLVSTDFKRLAFIRDNNVSFGKDIEFVIPKKAVTQLQKLEDEEKVSISVGVNNIFFDFGVKRIVARKVEGEFPFYEEYISPEMEKSIKFKRSEMISSLKRIENIIPGKVKRVVFEIDSEKLTISTDVTEIGAGKEVVPCEYSGEPFEIIFNSVHLREFLERFGEENVVLHVNDSNSPTRFVVDGGVKIGDRIVDYIYILVPFQF